MKTLADLAIENDQLLGYLAGYPEYSLVNPYADAPTYPSAVIDGIAERIAKDEVFRASFIEALIQLSCDPVYGWMALYYIRPLKSMEAKYGISVLLLPTQEQIGKNLHANKALFEKNRAWVGAMYDNGLWGDVVNMAKGLAEDYGLNIVQD